MDSTIYSLKVKNLEAFQTFLQTVIKFVPSVELVINKQGTKVMSVNESHTIRGFFMTDCLINENDDELKLCFQDVSKIQKTVILLRNVHPSMTNMTLTYDGTFLRYDGDSDFKFKTIKRELIEPYITEAVKSTLNTIYSFNTEARIIKQLILANNIISCEDARLYISKKNDKVIGEIEDKKNPLSNSIGIPISLGEITGEVDRVTCLLYKDFLTFSILPSDKIVITFTDKNVYSVNSEVVLEDGSSIKMTLIVPILKM